MITTLNVNEFVGNRDWKKLQGDFEQQDNIWNQIKKYYFNFIKEHVIEDDDILFLHEVPYIQETAYTHKNEIRYKRTVIKEKEGIDIYLKKSFLSLKSFCEENGYEILMNESDETSFFVSVAIFRKNQYHRAKINYKYKDYRNRIIAVEKINRPDETLIAIHAPSKEGEVEHFWNIVINLFKEAREIKHRKVLVLGDMNVYMPGSKQKHMFHRLLSEGMFDLWIESGCSHLDPTFKKNNSVTRIDYCLVSDNGYENYEIEKDDSTRQFQYTDHSVLTICKRV